MRLGVLPTGALQTLPSHADSSLLQSRTVRAHASLTLLFFFLPQISHALAASARATSNVTAIAGNSNLRRLSDLRKSIWGPETSLVAQGLSGAPSAEFLREANASGGNGASATRVVQARVTAHVTETLENRFPRAAFLAHAVHEEREACEAAHLNGPTVQMSSAVNQISRAAHPGRVQVQTTRARATAPCLAS